jgi:hypothetical protein
MALSKQVEDSLRASQEYLRDALSFSARTERPYISKHIADMLAQIDNLVEVVPLLDKLDNMDLKERLDEFTNNE